MYHLSVSEGLDLETLGQSPDQLDFGNDFYHDNDILQSVSCVGIGIKTISELIVINAVSKAITAKIVIFINRVA